MTPLLNLEGTVVTPSGVGGNWAVTVQTKAAKATTTACIVVDQRI